MLDTHLWMRSVAVFSSLFLIFRTSDFQRIRSAIAILHWCLLTWVKVFRVLIQSIKLDMGICKLGPGIRSRNMSDMISGGVLW